MTKEQRQEMVSVRRQEQITRSHGILQAIVESSDFFLKDYEKLDAGENF